MIKLKRAYKTPDGEIRYTEHLPCACKKPRGPIGGVCEDCSKAIPDARERRLIEAEQPKRRAK